MNLPVSANQLTMSSREISELTGKNHRNVKRDICNMIMQLNYPKVKVKDLPVFNRSELNGHEVSVSDYDHNGNSYSEFHLDHEYTMLLVSGYNVSLRMKIIKRWKELESNSTPQIPTNFAEALQLAADQAKQLELQAPKVAFVDNLVDRSALMNATQVAQKHGLSAVKLNKVLDELKVYNKAIKRGRAFQQWFVDKGYGQMKQTDLGYSQAMFTNAGEIWINEKLISEGVV